MSEPVEETREQFMVRPTGETLRKLEDRRIALGFLTSNALALVILTAAADVPDSKFWEMLAKVRSYQRPGIKKPNTRGGNRS